MKLHGKAVVYEASSKASRVDKTRNRSIAQSIVDILEKFTKRSSSSRSRVKPESLTKVTAVVFTDCAHHHLLREKSQLSVCWSGSFEDTRQSI